jgi:hypothetical protein
MIIAWTWWRDRGRLSRLAWLVSLFLRLATVAVLALALSGTDFLAWFRPRPRPVIVLIVDESRSMSLRDGGAEDRRSRADRIAARISADAGIAVARIGSESDFTDLGQAVADGAHRAPDALVLLSDGNHNRGASPVAVAVTAGIPVHVIGFGLVEAGPRPQISDILCPDQVEINEQFAIRAMTRGGSGRVTWVLSEDGRIVARAGSATGVRSVALSVRTAVPGLHRYQLAVAQDGEVSDRRGLTIVAVHKRIRIVWLDFSPGWNLRFAAQALSADPAFRLESFARSGGRWVKTRDPGPVPLDSMLPCDVIVVTGGNGETLPPELEQFIDRQVLGKGGGFWAIGDVRSTSVVLPLKPLEQRVASAGAVVLESGWRQSGLFPAQDTDVEARIRKGPPMSVTDRLAVTDSTVVVLAVTLSRPAGLNPLWAWRYAGAGRIMQFASTDLWKWKLGLTGAQRDTVFFDQSVINTVRWLAGREQQAFQAGPERSTYSPEEEVRFRGRWQRWDEPTGGAVRWNATITGPGGFRRTILLSDWGNGDFTAGLGTVGPGTYAYRTVFTVNGRILNRGGGEFFVEPGRDESQDLTQNRELLEEIATASGGRYFDAGLSPQDGAWLRRTAVREHGQRRGEHLLLLVLIVTGLLAAEWMVRRWQGLR